jgi:SAM-dependent methyltransferase
MAEISKGVRSILSVPWVYNLWGTLLGSRKACLRLANDYMQARPEERILDIGCGTGAFLDSLPGGVHYTGFDLSEDYIREARTTYGDRATFVHAAVGEKPDLGEGCFDLAIAVGVLHHLDDPEANALFELAASALKPGGRVVTIDPVFDERQSRTARWLISRDRGQNVRTRDSYQDLVSGAFSQCETEVLYDLIRIPYTHCVMTCRN